MAVSLPEPASGFYTSKHLKLHYTDWGNPDAPLLLMLHGGLEHSRVWDPLAQALRDRYHVVCPDLRGHGDSEWCTGGLYSVLDSVMDMVFLVRHLGKRPSVMMGHSWGGNVAVRYTAICPDDVTHLISIEGLSHFTTQDDTLLPGTRLIKLRNWLKEQEKLEGKQPRRYADIASAVDRLHAGYPRVERAFVEHIVRHGVRKNDDGTLSWKYDDMVRSGSPSDITQKELEQLWASIACPVLLIYGGKSWASNPAKDGRAALFQNARVELVEEAGHNIHHEQPEHSRKIISEFLAG